MWIFLFPWLLLCSMCFFCFSKAAIPRVLFRSHESPITALHPRFKEYLNRTMTDNPHHVQVYFDAQDRVDFVRTYFPQYLALYNALIPGAYKSDMWRYLVIYHFGGIYNDISMRYTKPIGHVVLHEHDEFVAAVDIDPTAMINGFFAAYAGHPILLKTIELVTDNIRNMRYGCDNLDVTGPRVFARAFRLFFYSAPLAPFPIHAATYSPPSSGQYRVHLLKFSIRDRTTSSASNKQSSTRNVWDRVQVITEAGDASSVCLKNKFDGYMDALYNNHSSTLPDNSPGGKQGEKYGTLWTERRVFLLTDEQKHHPHQQLADKYFYTNNLFRQGKSLWFLANNTKFTFPDYQTFLDMGLQDCLAVASLSPLAARTYSLLPEKALESTTPLGTSALQANLDTLGLWGKVNCNNTAPPPPPPLLQRSSNNTILDQAALLHFALNSPAVRQRGLARTVSWPELKSFLLLSRASHYKL